MFPRIHSHPSPDIDSPRPFGTRTARSRYEPVLPDEPDYSYMHPSTGETLEGMRGWNYRCGSDSVPPIVAPPACYPGVGSSFSAASSHRDSPLRSRLSSVPVTFEVLLALKRDLDAYPVGKPATNADVPADSWLPPPETEVFDTKLWPSFEVGQFGLEIDALQAQNTTLMLYLQDIRNRLASYEDEAYEEIGFEGDEQVNSTRLEEGAQEGKKMEKDETTAEDEKTENIVAGEEDTNTDDEFVDIDSDEREAASATAAGKAEKKEVPMDSQI